jgi:hypothetical protein
MATRSATAAGSLEVDADIFAALGSLTDSKKGTLSPLQDDAPLTPDARKQMAKLGILDGKSRIAPRYARALSVLASATRMARVQLFGTEGAFEYNVYFPAADGAPVSVRTSRAKIRIDDPASTDDAMAFLADMIGTSSVVGAEFKAELSPVDALVFAALVDGKRRNVLRHLADGASSDRSSNAATVKAELGRSGEPFITLASIVRSVAGVASIDDAALDRALESLIKGKQLQRRGKGVDLADAGTALAAALAHVELVFTLRAARVHKGGTVDQVGFTCAIAGLHGLLMIENVKGTVHFETTTSRALVASAQFFLREEGASR